MKVLGPLFLLVGMNFGAAAVKLGRNIRVPFVYDAHYSCVWPDKHRFPMSKFHRLYDCLIGDSVITPKDLIFPQIEEEDLMQAIYNMHDPNYVRRFENNHLNDKEKRRIGLHFDPQKILYDRTISELRGTMYTCDLALEYGLSCNLAGGTHHAHYDFGSGFCILNDIAIAAKRAVTRHNVGNVLIFDCDVHQGDGTATLFQDEPRVFTASLHCEKNFPFRKANSDMDISLQSGMQDEEYLKIVLAALDDAVQQCNPGLIIYDAGVDIAKDDRLGNLEISDTGIYQRDRIVLDACVNTYKIPVASVIGGGYGERLAYRHSLLHRAAIDVTNNNRKRI